MPSEEDLRVMGDPWKSAGSTSARSTAPLPAHLRCEAVPMLAPLVALVLARSVTGPCPVTDGREQVRLSVGTQKVVTGLEAREVHAERPARVEVKQVGSDTLLLIGVAEGRSLTGALRRQGQPRAGRRRRPGRRL